jgi:hypothetical protein
MLRHLKYLGRIIFILFSLQIAIDGIVLSYFSNAEKTELNHLMSDFCIHQASHHSHEDNPLFISSNQKNNSISPDKVLIIMTQYPLPNCFSVSIWQPPKIS